MLAAMLFLLTGCGTSSVFDGSRISDASGFWIEYSILNQEESADLNLTEGDHLKVSLSHTEVYSSGSKNKEHIAEILNASNAQLIRRFKISSLSVSQALAWVFSCGCLPHVV